jgi:predicted acetyltransferase
MTVELVLADSSQRQTIDELMQMYLYDLSAFTDDQPDDEGRFHYPYLSHYWQEPDRFPYLILGQGELAGFALVRGIMDPVNGDKLMEMAEFFVTKSYRRKGVGARAARLIWNEFPGKWQVRVFARNDRACKFWRRTISDANAGFVESSNSEKTYQQVVFEFSN